jgi:LmbE family N-acetylglucosaminyl deacetylase
MRTVYLSPHLDDAVLSCGGAIHQQTAAGQAVLVITIFAGQPATTDLSPFALVQQHYWGNPPQPLALRRAEDAAALAYLNSEVAHLDYLDCVYRTSPDGRWLYTNEEALWAEVDPADPMIQEETGGLIGHLVELLPEREQVTICAPLSAGHHVDHQIVHSAARKLSGMEYRVIFYEDYPYAAKPGEPEATLTAIGGEAWHVESLPLSVADVTAKVFALGYYRSQMSILFGGAETMPNRLWAFATSRSADVCLAERIWHIPGTPASAGVPPGREGKRTPVVAAVERSQ